MNNQTILAHFLLAIITSITVSARADFASAMYYYQSENYSLAQQEFLPLAALGHHDSQFNLGAMYYRGQGVQQNNTEAYAWIALSAEPDNIERQQLSAQLLKKMTKSEQLAAQQRKAELVATFGEPVVQKKYMPVSVSNADSAYALIPIAQPEPKYPTTAKRIGLSGSVDVEYIIDTEGHVKNYTVTASTNKIFNASVLAAVKKWRYQPWQLEEQVTERVGVRNRIYFRMADDELTENKQEDYLSELRYQAQGGTAADVFIYAFVADLIPEVGLTWAEINHYYYSAAQAGLTQAQYQLGLNLLYGKGCVADTAKAIAWLTLAAQANNAAAQTLLATELMSSSPNDATLAQAWDWLSSASKLGYPRALLQQAWHLSTTSIAEQRNGKQAAELVLALPDDYPDEFSFSKVLAASQAAVGDFKAAKKSQKKVLKIAKDLGLPQAIEKQRLSAYENNTVWQE